MPYLHRLFALSGPRLAAGWKAVALARHPHAGHALRQLLDAWLDLWQATRPLLAAGRARLVAQCAQQAARFEHRFRQLPAGRRRTALWSAFGVAGLLCAALLAVAMRAAADDKAAAAPKPALSVNVTHPKSLPLGLTLQANGNVAAWQEAVIGTEANGLRLTEVRVNVGDRVRRGEVLAAFAAETVNADLAQSRAAVAEAEAALAEAAANAQRARTLQTTGALSAQQISQYLSTERAAHARLDAQRAAARVQQLRLAQAQVLAPDDGVISARSATVGAVLPAGQELFRMIRKGRLEWRAEVPAAELARISPGMAAQVDVAPGGASAAPIAGRVRMVAPTVDAQTRNGLVYVDLPAGSAARAGMFARGEFMLGNGNGLTLPQSAVLLREGFAYVLRVGPDSKVMQTKVGIGRRTGDRIEITSGLDAAAQVVASGAGFLADGDTVRVLTGGLVPSLSPVVPPAAMSSSVASSVPPASRSRGARSRVAAAAAPPPLLLALSWHADAPQ